MNKIINMLNKKLNKLELYQFENLIKYNGILHFITARNGGISSKPFESLNLGYKSGDKPENVRTNWKILERNLGLEDKKIVLLNQLHSDKIVIIEDILKDNSIYEKDGDAIITNQHGILIVVLVADCVPIIIYDKNNSIIAVVHAGWRGSTLNIAKKTVNQMKRSFHSKPENIIVGIGPSIGPCCYEVKKDVVKHFIDYKYAVIKRKNQYYINLWEINRAQLINAGLKESNIEIAGLCTSCNIKHFFSYRNKHPTGRFAAGVMLK